MNTTRKRADLAAFWVALALPLAASAQDLSLPGGAMMTREVVRDPGTYALPTGPWQPELGVPTTRVEGRISTRAWRVDGSGLTPLQLLGPLRAQLIDEGFEVLLDCTNIACGGFDFRFAIAVMPAPAMYVDLTDYHFVSARAGDGTAVSVLASRDTNAGYVQIIRAGGAGGKTQTDAAPVAVAVKPTTGIPAQLEKDGHAILRDLLFNSGSFSLGEGSVASLDSIAEYLKANPSRRILFVGHTDATGSLEANQSLSRRRAQAAVDYLRARGIPEDQLGADGVGYLAPIATNLTPEGRDANRRVEAVLISTR